MKRGEAQSPSALEAALPAAADGVIVVDRQGLGTFVNEAGRKLVWEPPPTQPQPVRRAPDVRLRYPDGRPVPPGEAPLVRALRGEATVDPEFVLSKPDGADVRVSATAAPVRDERGGVVGAMVIFHDIGERKRAEQALRESEELARNTLDSLPEHIAVLDRDGTIVAVNRAWRQYGAEQGGVPGRSGVGVNYLTVCRSAVGESADEAPLALEGIEAILVGSRDLFTLEYPCHSPGVRRWFRLYACPLAGGRGGAVVSHVDITERKLAEEALGESRRVLERTLAALRDAVFVIDAATVRILDCNPAASSIFGYRRDEMVGRTVEFLHVDTAALAEFRRRLYPAVEEKGYLYLPDFRMKRKDGSIFPTEHSVMPLEDDAGRRIGWVSVVRDTTERKRADQLREEYLSLISHDLRNPLTALTGQTDWLRRVLKQQGLEREAATAETILKSARRLNSMIQDLVESARLESGQLKLRCEPTDLLHLVSDLAERVGTLQDRARIRVESPEWVPPVMADPERIERAVTNLVTNALKYSAPDRPVVVRVGRADGEAVLSVIDQGVGIPPAELPHLFKRFHRAKTADKPEGLGLGLYIARLIVEAHGGRIWAVSEPGKGSAFSFSLRLA